MQLQNLREELEERNIVVIAVAQEDTDLESHGLILSKFEEDHPFEVVADLGHEQTQLYDRTTTYWIDLDGIVHEIFPAMIHMRPNWQAVFNRMDELMALEQ